MDAGTFTHATYRAEALNGIALDMLEDGLEYLKRFNRNIGRYYTPDVRKRQLTQNPYATFLQFVNYGRGAVAPVKARCLAWRDRDSGKLVFTKRARAYRGSHYKEQLEQRWSG